MKTRTDLLKLIIAKMDYKSYLEIGIYEGENYSKINIDRKVGVDPNCGIEGVRREFSDDFFKNNTEKFDLIFVDGDHSYQQVKKDVENALNAITPNGMVVMHDTCPPTIAHAGRYREGEWCGDAYKVAIEQNNSPYANVITWKNDFGVTLITKDNTEPQSYGLSYSDLTANNFKAVNVQHSGVIVSYLDALRTFKIDEDLDRVELEEEKTFDIEQIDLKDYYKLCFPDRKIGRKKEETLIKELKEGGFEV